MRRAPLRGAVVTVAAFLAGAGVARADERAQAAALASQPEVPAYRGGTLGMPPGTGAGVGALIAGQFRFSDRQFSPALFARIGRLQLSPGVQLEALGESSNFDVPTVGLAGKPGARPLPLMKTSTISSAGVRVIIGHGVSSADRKALALCLGLRGDPTAATPDQKENCKKLGMDITGRRSAEDDAAALTLALQSRMRGFGFGAGLRGLYGADLAGGASGGPTGGFAVEAVPQYLFATGGVFLSGSLMHLTGTKSSTGDAVVETLGMWEARGTVGFHKQGAASGDDASGYLPRVGAYVTVARNFWKNPYFAPGTNQNVRGTQIEATLYASGHWTGGFGGLLSLSVLRPYGAEDHAQFVISFAPAVGAALPGGGVL